MIRLFRLGVCMFIAMFFLTGCAADDRTAAVKPSKYQQQDFWAFKEVDPNRAVDVFFVAPTVYTGDGKEPNMPLDDENMRQKFAGAVKMEKGLYDEACNFFAPYYGQVGLPVYMLSDEIAAPYFDQAYADVKEAFLYYMQHENKGRPVILAGFSQGAQMLVRLMKECGADPRVESQLVAVYAIGWRVTEEDVRNYPQLKMAKGPTDTGVIVSFNTEAPEVTESLLVPAGEKALAINPLNWSASSDPVSRELNRGAVFLNVKGEVQKELPRFTGAYLDNVRGVIKVTDVNEAQYPSVIPIMEDGVYHIYDYMFFYRNIQQNVKDRVEAYLKEQQTAEKKAA